ncbi:MAG: hypothetical protein ACUVXB_06105 [Bryobacteraceae bacterium]
MDEFLANARRLLQTAKVASQTLDSDEVLAILIRHDGAIRAVSSADWPLESLALEHGARMAYRISRTGRRVRVEGRHGLRCCLLQAELPAPVYRSPVPAISASLIRTSLT